MNPIFFTSERNYMKRDPSSGSTSLGPPKTSAYSGYLYTTSYTVTHNLGYTPLFRAYYEPFGDGIIWPPMGTRIGQSVVNPNNTSQTGPGMIVYPNTAQIIIEIFYGSNTLTADYPVYWVIYQDYTI